MGISIKIANNGWDYPGQPPSANIVLTNHAPPPHTYAYYLSPQNTVSTGSQNMEKYIHIRCFTYPIGI